MTQIVNLLSVVLGGSWAAGLNLYLTVAGLGLAHRFEWIVLPGDLEIIAHPIVIMLAIVLYAVEFFADKIPYVDSAWDSVHTFIRPAGGIAMAYMAGSEMEPIMQTSLALASGALTLESHTAKATTRAAINTSPEPITNSIASVTEDAIVVGLLWFIINHPFWSLVILTALVIFSVWLIGKLFKFIGFMLKKLFGKKESKPEVEILRGE